MNRLLQTIFLLALLPFLLLGESSSPRENPACKWTAEDYVANAFLQFRWAKKFFFDRYTWSGNERVLDIGSGDGRLTFLISQCTPFGDVLGIDNSLSMVSYASKTYEASSNLRFELVDAADLDFYSGNASIFDLVVAFHTLHWVENQRNVLAGIKASLKPGGKAFLRLTSKGWDPVQDIADELINSEKWRSQFAGFSDPIHRFSEEEYLCLVNEAGLRPIRIEDVVDDDVLPNIDVLMKQIKSWLPHVKYLSAQSQEEFLKDLATSYLTRVPPAENGSIHLYDCYLEVELAND